VKRHPAKAEDYDRHGCFFNYTSFAVKPSSMRLIEPKSGRRPRTVARPFHATAVAIASSIRVGAYCPGPSRSRHSLIDYGRTRGSSRVAGLLNARDPLGPHSLALAEAILLPLHNAGFPRHETSLAFFLILDYTSDSRSAAPTSPSTNNGSRTRHPENGFTPHPSRPRRNTSGSTTETGDSPPASTHSSTA